MFHNKIKHSKSMPRIQKKYKPRTPEGMAAGITDPVWIFREILPAKLKCDS